MIQLPIPIDQLKDSKNSFLTQGLFYEFRHVSSSQDKTIFTLKEEDSENGLSLYKLYMSYDTEYEFAKGVFGSLKFWNKLKNVSWFQPNLKEWREEKKEQHASEAVKAILAEVRFGNYQAAKYILETIEKEVKDTTKNSQGRPSKQKLTEKEILDDNEDIKDRFNLIGKGV